MTDNKLSLPDSVDNALKNLTDEPSKNAGQTLADIWFLVFGGVTQAANKRKLKYAKDLEKFQHEIKDSYDKIPDKKRIEPSIHITAQALENSKYCVSSESLRGMFVKLISGSMNKDLEPNVHPSFPEILKQMSEHDALLLQILKTKTKIPVANIGLEVGANSYDIQSTDVCPDYPQLSSERCTVSVSSLCRSGLAITSYTIFYKDKSVYNLIEKTARYRKSYIESRRLGKQLYFQQGICKLTPLGENFISICV